MSANLKRRETEAVPDPRSRRARIDANERRFLRLKVSSEIWFASGAGDAEWTDPVEEILPARVLLQELSLEVESNDDDGPSPATGRNLSRLSAALREHFATRGSTDHFQLSLSGAWPLYPAQIGAILGAGDPFRLTLGRTPDDETADAATTTTTNVRDVLQWMLRGGEDSAPLDLRVSGDFADAHGGVLADLLASSLCRPTRLTLDGAPDRLTEMGPALLELSVIARPGDATAGRLQRLFERLAARDVAIGKFDVHFGGDLPLDAKTARAFEASLCKMRRLDIRGPPAYLFPEGHDAGDLRAAILACAALQDLRIVGARWRIAEAAALAAAITTVEGIERIRLSSHFDGEGLVVIVATLAEKARTESDRRRSGGQAGGAGQANANANANATPFLLELHLSQRAVDVAHAGDLAASLAEFIACDGAESLALSNFPFSDLQTSHLVDALLANRSMLHLDISPADASLTAGPLTEDSIARVTPSNVTLLRLGISLSSVSAIRETVSREMTLNRTIASHRKKLLALTHRLLLEDR